MRIKLPNRIKVKLQQEESCYANIIKLGENIENYYSLSPVFFPDYTIHGVLHVETVLEIADKLIPDESLNAMNSRNIAVLIAAIMLHDIGMFITEDGFHEILFGDSANRFTKHLDDNSWKDAWDVYLEDIKHYSGRELYMIFGDSVPVKSPCTDRAKMKRKDYLVCGEFIRKYHHRLAHDIAIHGFPGTKNRDVFSNTGFSQYERDIIGLIARSHGMNVRETEAYISKKYGDATSPNNILIFYLMAVLRLADYLDAGQHRAPKELEERQEISVPISHREWLWNQQIDLNNYSWHPEKKSVIIQADPQITSDFIKIEKWLKTVQQELDVSWAIITEKYIVEKCHLSIHRIKSNILQSETRAEMDCRFLTKEAKLTANVELLKLLIQPLYGNDPSFGVRELIQNAVDACLERKQLESDDSNYKAEIIVSLDTKRKIFTITDNGIGMNEDVLLNYYLSAGSSFRFSKEWLKNFSNENETLISRTGKFGIGVLSTFLLGTTVSVRTRHMYDTLGYVFSFSLEQDSIDVSRNECDIGTAITIRLNDDVIRSLTSPFEKYGSVSWYNWYHFREPKIRYYVDGKEKYKIKEFAPQTNEPQSLWFQYKSDNYQSFQWSYKSKCVNYCNGIIIPKTETSVIGYDTGMRVRVPRLSIVDTECNLDVSLDRSSILTFPEKDKFNIELYKYLLAKILSVKWDTEFDKKCNFKYGFNYIKDAFRPYASYIVSSEGFTIYLPPFIHMAKVSNLIMIGYRNNVDISELPLSGSGIPIYLHNIKNDRESIDFYKSIINERFLLSRLAIENFQYKPHIKLLRFWEEKKSFDEIKNRLQKGFFTSFKELFTYESYYRYDSIDHHSQTPIIEDKLNPNLFPFIAEYYINVSNRLENNMMLDVIEEYLGNDIWIPYDMEERKKKFPKAFKELRQYMDD